LQTSQRLLLPESTFLLPDGVEIAVEGTRNGPKTSGDAKEDEDEREEVGQGDELVKSGVKLREGEA
jgi:hypothetical protein